MEIGLFEMPAHPPERSIPDAAEWDLQMIRWADKYGFAEAWIGEHFNYAWEPCPAPDLLIAQALLQTKTIRLGAGGHILAAHHPTTLAHRIAYLDQLSGGRINLGITAGAGPADLGAFGIDMASGENRVVMAEALDVILGIWKRDTPFQHEGRYWKTHRLDSDGDPMQGHHVWPLQSPHPPIGIGGFSPRSQSLALAGSRGFLPLSFALQDELLLQNWQAVEEGARSTGLTPRRGDWRIVIPIVVADTDQAAHDFATASFLARFFKEFWVPVLRRLGGIEMLKNDPAMPDEAITAEYLARERWLVGSPGTVAAKIERLFDLTGGFGTIVMLGVDCSDTPDPWRRSMELMGREVKPRLAHLAPDDA